MLLKSLYFQIKPILAKFYFIIFKPFIYRAFLNYKFSDEKLKFVHILEAINYVRIANLPHVYFEFGCHSARTFNSAIQAFQYFRMDQARFYAFDSFLGLPEVDDKNDGTFQTHEYKTTRQSFIKEVKKKSHINLSDESIIEGFYSESLTAELQKKMPKAGVIHIDVDLYSSSISVLDFIKPLLTIGTVILFDDWYCFPAGSDKGEGRAFKEFCQNYPNFSFEEWKNYSTFGKSIFVTGLP